MNIIDELSCNQSPGLDGLTAKHMKFADSQLVVLYYLVLYPLFWCMVIYQNQSKSVIVTVIKDKNRRVNEKGNYRPICLSHICSKIIDAVLFNRTDTYLQDNRCCVIQQNGYVLAR